MGTILTASIAALMASAGVIAGLQRPAFSMGLVDQPCARRRHERATPVIGGLGIVAGFILAMLLLNGQVHWPGLLAGIALLAAVGVADDLRELSSFTRLLAQFVAVALVVFWSGLHVTHLGNLIGFGPIGLWIFALPFTILCMLLMINAVNMLDGVDGLAGGSALVMLAGFTALLALDGSSTWVLPLVLALAVLGFLPFNLRAPWRKRASVFMGDAGSTILGFALAWLAIYATQTESASVSPVAVAWVLILPAADALSLFFRRLRQGRSPLAADRCHLHHVLVRSGVSMTVTVYLLIMAQAMCVGIGIVGWHYRVPEWIMFWPLAMLFATYQIVMWNAPATLRFLRRRLRQAAVTSR